MLIDYEFGLSQLSGNQALLIKLFSRLHDEYKDANNQLDHLLNEGELDAAKTLIHTLKGVAGNLGCVQLHQTSRDYDDALKSGGVPDDIKSSFADALSQTIAELAKVMATDKVPPEDSQPEQSLPSSNTALSDNVKRMISALNNNEFVTPDHLAACMSELSLDDREKAALEQAINTLDYQRALAILVN